MQFPINIDPCLWWSVVHFGGYPHCCSERDWAEIWTADSVAWLPGCLNSADFIIITLYLPWSPYCPQGPHSADLSWHSSHSRPLSRMSRCCVSSLCVWLTLAGRKAVIRLRQDSECLWPGRHHTPPSWPLHAASHWGWASYHGLLLTNTIITKKWIWKSNSK